MARSHTPLMGAKRTMVRPQHVIALALLPVVLSLAAAVAWGEPPRSDDPPPYEASNDAGADATPPVDTDGRPSPTLPLPPPAASSDGR
jgi:hypothetical protein